MSPAERRSAPFAMGWLADREPGSRTGLDFVEPPGPIAPFSSMTYTVKPESGVRRLWRLWGSLPLSCKLFLLVACTQAFLAAIFAATQVSRSGNGVGRALHYLNAS